MFHKFLVVLLVFAGQTAFAQSIYSWKDASGRIHYSDTPPSDGKVRTVRQPALAPGQTAPADGARPAQESYVDKELAFRKRLAEKAETEEKARKDKADSEQRQRECSASKQYLAGLESGQRIVRFNEAGERIFMDDDERAAEIERTRKAVERICK